MDSNIVGAIIGAIATILAAVVAVVLSAKMKKRNAEKEPLKESNSPYNPVGPTLVYYYVCSCIIKKVSAETLTCKLDGS